MSRGKKGKGEVGQRGMMQKGRRTRRHERVEGRQAANPKSKPTADG